jgi:nitrile hydratase subunit beta
MSDKPINRGPHDLGGDAAGPIDTADHGMRFWEKQANAMRGLLTSKKVVCTDELRRAAEALGDRYYQLAYFERTTAALRTLLLEKGVVTEAELAAKMADVRKRFDVPPESESPVKKRARR